MVDQNLILASAGLSLRSAYCKAAELLKEGATGVRFPALLKTSPQPPGTLTFLVVLDLWTDIEFWVV